MVNSKRKRSSSTDDIESVRKEEIPMKQSRPSSTPIENVEKCPTASDLIAQNNNEEYNVTLEKPSTSREQSESIPCQNTQPIGMSHNNSSTAPKKMESLKSLVKEDKENFIQSRMDALRVTIGRIEMLQQEMNFSYNAMNDAEIYDSEYVTELYRQLGPEITSILQNADAKALGFIACAQETIKYLTAQGISRDNPMMINLRDRLIEGINNI